MDDIKITVVDELTEEARNKFVDESIETALSRMDETLGKAMEREDNAPLNFGELEFSLKILNHPDKVEVNVKGRHDDEVTNTVYTLKQK